MNPKAMVWISVLLSAVAQVFLKQGMNGLRRRNVQVQSSLLALSMAVIREGWVWLWGACFVVATALWLLAVQRLDLSYAFPLLSVGYILVNLLSAVFFRERVGGMRWLSVAIISMGVVLIAGS